MCRPVYYTVIIGCHLTKSLCRVALPRDVPTDSNFLRNKAGVLRDKLQLTLCTTLKIYFLTTILLGNWQRLSAALGPTMFSQYNWIQQWKGTDLPSQLCLFNYTHQHMPMYIYIYYLRRLKFTLKHLKRSYMFRSHDHPQGAYIVPC